MPDMRFDMCYNNKDANTMKLHRNSITAVCILVLVGAALVSPRFMHWRSVREAEALLERELPDVTLPDPRPLAPRSLGEVGSPNPSPNSVSSPQQIQNDILLSEINLPVPFTPQAPHANWAMPYKEACEEASALMAIRYSFGNPILQLKESVSPAIHCGVRIIITHEFIRGWVGSADSR